MADRINRKRNVFNFTLGELQQVRYIGAVPASKGPAPRSFPGKESFRYDRDVVQRLHRLGRPDSGGGIFVTGGKISIQKGFGRVRH